ncbi:MAG: SurA N-terminal domain-containing protein [bacterium]
MLTAIREGSKGWISGIIIGLIVLTFALFGISSYLEGGQETPVATVNGDEIDVYAYQNELAQQRQSLTERFGSSFDPALLDNLGIKDRVLDTLIDSRLLSQHTVEKNYRLSDQLLAGRIQQSEVFRTDGQFDAEKYQNILASNRLTPQGYEAIERQSGVASQLRKGIVDSAFTVENELDRLLVLQTQTREVDYVVIPAATYMDEFDVKEEEAQKEYDNNIDRYQREARIKVEYIDLSVDELAADIVPTDDEVEQTFERMKGRFKSPEVRKASHILVSVDADADEATKSERLNFAQELFDKASGEADFSELAKQHSDDSGSSGNGGDLGVVTRGQMVQPFEDAVFSMGLDEITGPIETQFGFHIIKLTELTEERQQALDEVQEEIAMEARKASAEALFADLVEPFQNLIFEQPESLGPAEDETGLKVQTSDWFTLNQGQGIAAEPAVRRAAFAEDVLDEGLNSQAIELGFDRMVAIRKLDYEAASPMPFEDVKEAIVTDLKLQQSKARAEEISLESINGLTHEASWDIMLATNEWERQSLANRRPEIEPALAALADKVYSSEVPESGSPLFGQVVLPNGDAVIYSLNKVEAGSAEDVDQTLKDQLAQQLINRDGAGMYQLFIKNLRATAEIVIDQEQL